MESEARKALLDLGFEEEVDEEVNVVGPGLDSPSNYRRTLYPKPVKRYRLVFENYSTSIEEPYFWVLNHVKQDQAYHTVTKITDTLTASENSSIFGVQTQRLNLQQDKIAQYMGTIAQMVKSLFQIVREIRVIKERLHHYEGSLQGHKSSDIALKGYWVDLVEGGGKNPASIYGLASQLGFATLPDLFFEVNVPEGEDPSKIVDQQASGFNQKVREVLKRKLQQYVTWRKETRGELKTRHKFTLRYLRQHWNTIRMYISWIKPMLKNVKRLETSEKFRDNAEILTSMEGALMEIEFLAEKDAIKGYHPVILVNFLYRVRPTMNYNGEGYQRGPSHVGRVTMTFRAYSWTQEQIENYKKYRDEEDLEFLAMIDESVSAAMEALGDELRDYLREAEQEVGLGKEEEEEAKPVVKVKGPSVFEPFTSLFGGFAEVAKVMMPASKPKKSGDPGTAAGAAKGGLFQIYKNFKKAHGMLAW